MSPSSRRQWDGLIKSWKRSLHQWDPDGPKHQQPQPGERSKAERTTSWAEEVEAEEKERLEESKEDVEIPAAAEEEEERGEKDGFLDEEGRNREYARVLEEYNKAPGVWEMPLGKYSNVAFVVLVNAVLAYYMFS